MKAASSPAAQQLAGKNLSNILFVLFVVGVLIFSVIAAIYYEPTDPWMDTSKSISKVLDSVKQPVFKPDETVIQTGEDFQGQSDSSAQAPAISEALVEAVEHNVSEVHKIAGCSSHGKWINCSDPGVLAAVVKYNLQRYPNLKFYSYDTPVRGGKEDECDFTWRFRFWKERSWRLYRGHRRLNFSVDEDTCTYKMGKELPWPLKRKTKPFSVRKGPFAGNRVPRKAKKKNNLTVTEEVEVIDDSIPLPPSVNAFKKNKYLYYSTGGDRCKGMSHFLWSFLCALGEAQYLNRTLVMDLTFCLSGSNNPGHGDEDDKDFRLYFDFVRLKEAASVIDKKHFLESWELAKRHQGSIPVTEVTDFKVTPMELQNLTSSIIWRKFDAPEPNNYWYRVCEGETEKVIQRPWNLLWKSKRLMDIVNTICNKLEWNFDAIHVVRGYKASNKDLWPNLDANTSPSAILETVKGKIEEQRSVYIATNELQEGYFDQLKAKYKVFTLDDFKDLWAENSLWYNETKELIGHPVEFDGYMRVEVDTEVFFRAKNRFETFNDLTKDCKNGINTC